MEMEVSAMKKAVFALLLVCVISLPLTAFAREVSPQYWLTVWGDEAWFESGHFNDLFFHNNHYFTVTTNDEVLPYPVVVNVRSLPERQGGLDIYGDVPVLTTRKFEYDHINERIDEIVDLLIADARRLRARSVTFDFDEYVADSVISVLIEANVSSVISRTLVRSVNFDPETGRLITVRDVMDFDIIPLAERILTDRMRRQPENYYAAQSVYLESQAFFVNRQGITILFDEFQLSAMVSGIRQLEIRRRNIRVVTVDQSSVRTDEGYNLLLVPLRDIVEGLGYHVVWCNLENKAIIYSRSPLLGGQRLAWLQPGRNEYSTPVMQRSLEAAPAVHEGGSMYVPITFFEQILTLTSYSIDEDGNITFLAYLE